MNEDDLQFERLYPTPDERDRWSPRPNILGLREMHPHQRMIIQPDPVKNALRFIKSISEFGLIPMADSFGRMGRAARRARNAMTDLDKLGLSIVMESLEEEKKAAEEPERVEIKGDFAYHTKGAYTWIETLPPSTPLQPGQKMLLGVS